MGQRSEKFFQKTLILVFKVVIVQPPKTHFLTFSSETKIMKITHSAEPPILKLVAWHAKISFTTKNFKSR